MVSSRYRARSVLIFLVCCFTPAVAQQPSPTKVSVRQLTAEQIAVYKTFLEDFLSGSNSSINVSTTTRPFEPNKDDLQGCLIGFPHASRTKELQQLADSLVNNRVHFVDPATYKVAQVGDFMRQGEDLDGAVQSAFDRGLMSLSEVVFDRGHKRAALSFSFQCGQLCGHGGVVIYELRNGQWQRSKRHCGSRIS